MSPIKVVKATKKGKSINFMDFIFKSKKSPSFTTLTGRQKIAIKNIELYWLNRIRNYNNWKTQKHWSLRKETISSRLDTHTWSLLKNNNNSKSIQNFIRKFLRESSFRDKFNEILWKQYRNDPGFEFLQYLDPSDFKNALINLFPHVVSGEITVIEKELFTFYNTFMCQFSISYVLRIALIHFRDLENQDTLKFDEVLEIMDSMIN